MSRNTFLKTVACVAAVPAIVGATITGFQKPVNALSASTISTTQTTQTIDSLEIPTSVAPSELISRYAVYDFRLINDRSRSMHYFYASPSNVSSWEEDLLGSGTLSSGSSITVSIDDNRASCYYDFKAVFSDGSESTSYDVNVCTLSSYTF